MQTALSMGRTHSYSICCDDIRSRNALDEPENLTEYVAHRPARTRLWPRSPRCCAAMPTELANVNISQPALVCVFYVPACNYLARGVVCGDVCARCEVRKLRSHRAEKVCFARAAALQFSCPAAGSDVAVLHGSATQAWARNHLDNLLRPHGASLFIVVSPSNWCGATESSIAALTK